MRLLRIKGYIMIGYLITSYVIFLRRISSIILGLLQSDSIKITFVNIMTIEIYTLYGIIINNLKNNSFIV